MGRITGRQRLPVGPSGLLLRWLIGAELVKRGAVRLSSHTQGLKESRGPEFPRISVEIDAAVVQHAMNY